MLLNFFMILHPNKELFMIENFMALFDPRLVIANEKLESVADINTDKHAELGIEAYIFDIDYTLPRTNEEYLYYADVSDKLREIKYKFRVCALSNSTGSNDDRNNLRAKLFEASAGIGVVSSPVKKPNPSAFKYALDYLGTSPEETCMVGDSILTDIIGANRTGIYTVLVSQLVQEPIPITRWINKTLYKLNIGRVSI